MNRQSLGTIGGVQKTLDMHSWVIVGVVVVTVLGLATMLVTVGGMITSASAEKQATSQAIRDQIKSQNDKIEELNTSVSNLTKVLQDEQKTR